MPFTVISSAWGADMRHICMFTGAVGFQLTLYFSHLNMYFSRLAIGQLILATCGNAALWELGLADWKRRCAGRDGTGPRIYTAPGCAKCKHTGHKGRVGVYELMTATPASKKLIQARAPVDQLFRCALKDGMLTLRQYGLLKVLEGLTDRISIRSACA
jgi:hypothetical protein